MSGPIPDQPETRFSSGAKPAWTIASRVRDLGGFTVRRVLPDADCPTIGPFVFFDQVGPADLPPGQGIDVRPHPHIGLATVTYLFDGEIMHRDSLGSVQPIRPGELNWMTAGRGIVHSERTPPEIRQRGSRLFGIQAWVALPKAFEETEPTFEHYGSEALPILEEPDRRLCVIAGELYGVRSPVKTHSALFYVDARLAAGAVLSLPAEYPERAIHIAAGRVEVAGGVFDDGRMLVFRDGHSITLRALEPARLMLLGGEPLDGPRYIWWNLVSSSTERIARAKADWQVGRFPAVPGETDFIPLPDEA
jgi:redox-sensitive bicupin YhaK (pirin superfamily)